MNKNIFSYNLWVNIMCKKSKLSNFIIWTLIVFLFGVICFIFHFKNNLTITYKYKDDLKFELQEKVSICTKNDSGYKMIDYYFDKDEKELDIISLYLGETKYLDEINYIPTNFILDISDVYVKNNNLFIEYNSSQGSFNEETFKMLKITFKKLGYDNIYLQKL